MANRDVTPDQSLLQHIFADNQPSSISILLQNWDKCVFTAVLPTTLGNGPHVYVVRLEARDGKSAHFHSVAAMQEIAASCIPGLVPQTLQVGSAVNDQGREF
jgi:hypothetical protein